MRKKDLKALIRHIWIHLGYPEGGYLQMTTEQKALFDKIIGRLSPLYDRLDEDQRRRYNQIHKKAKRVARA